MKKAHSCVVRPAYVKGRRVRHWLPPPPARNPDIADILHLPRLHSSIAMAGRTEVPDSEDEPMTSSPVNILDGAADKLSEATPVSLRDAQDSLHEAAQPHQANAENVAHPHAERTDGADRENASLDVEASRVDHTNIQPNIATSGENHTSQAHSGQVSPFPPNSSSHVEAQLVDTDMTSQPDVVTTSTTPDTLQEAGQTTATEYVDTGTPATDMTSLAPGIKYSDKEMKMHDQPKSATQADLLGHAERSSDGVKPSASGPINIEQKSEESERVTVDSFISNNGKPENNPSAQPTKPDTSHNTPNTPMDSQSESASTVADLPTPAMNVPVVGSHHVTGDRAVQQMPEDGMSEAHVQNSDSGPVAEQAVCLSVIFLLSACLRFSRPPLTRARVRACNTEMELWMSR
jgi:hypothetical protein